MRAPLLITVICLAFFAEGSPLSRIYPGGNLKVFLRTAGCVETADCSWFQDDMDVISFLPFNFSNSYTNFVLDSNNSVIKFQIYKEHDIPLIFYCLKNLKELIILYSNITSLSADIQNFKELRHLRLSDMKQLSKLPEELGNLRALEKLSIDYCSQVAHLPHTFGKLSNLQQLEIRFTSIRELPLEVTDLWQLRELNLHLNRMSYLPRSMSRLSSLAYLELDQISWNSLNELAGIPNLDTLRLRASYDDYISDFPLSISNLTTLRRRPVLVYVHHDESMLDNIFCNRIFCSTTIIEYLLENYIVWPCDVTLEGNRNRLTNIFQEILPDQVINSFDVNKYPKLLGIKRIAQAQRGDSFLFGYQSELLLEGDVLVRNQVISNRKNVLEELIFFKNECDENEQSFSYYLNIQTRLGRNAIHHIVKYITLNDAINAFTINILPLLRERETPVEICDPDSLFINTILPKLKAKQVISLRLTTNWFCTEQDLSRLNSFSNIFTLSLFNFPDIKLINIYQNYFPQIKNLCLWYDSEVNFTLLHDLFGYLNYSIKRFEVHCPGYVCPHFNPDQCKVAFCGAYGIEYFLFDALHIATNTRNFFVLLITITYITGQCVVLADNNTGGNQSFSDRIKSLQNETGYLCSFIEGAALVGTKEFITLIRDAHIHSPNLKAMEILLTNITNQADTYHSSVIKQLSDCKALLYMLTESLDNGGMVDYYLNEGNYSVVTSSIDKWHQSFLDFRSKFYLTDTALDIIISNKKVFFYDNWIGDVAKSAVTLFVLLISSVIVLQVFKRVAFIFWIITLFSPPSKDSDQENSFDINFGLPKVEALQANSGNDVHKPNSTAKKKQTSSSSKSDTTQFTSNTSELEKRITTISSTTSVYNKLYTIVTIVAWFTVLCCLIAITVLWDPSKILFSKSPLYNWYPDATTAIENMRVDRDKVQPIVSRQILSIEELQRYTSMYHDETIQINVDELVSNLGTGIRQANKELSEVYIASEKLPSTFRQAYINIEAHAKKAGRLAEANKLLTALSETSITYEKLQRGVQTLMINQKNLLPKLKEQTQIMQTLVQQGQVMEINRIAKEHTNIIMDIEGEILNVTLVVEQLIKITENDGSDGMKMTIKELRDKTSTDQVMAILYEATGGIVGTLGSAVLGTVVIKSGYAVVSITATAVAGPIAAAVGGVGLVGLGAYALVTGFDKYNDASRYKTELDILEVQRGNFHAAMKNFEKAIIAQQTASKATLTSLNSLVAHSASFSSIPGFKLPLVKRTALSKELLHIILQYNTMIGVFNSFKPYTTVKDQELLSA
ncbi:unnamed protein product [Rotaria magnacalcarata]